jgi:translation initiation factor IF-2
MPMKTITEFSGSVLVAAARFVKPPQPASPPTEPPAPAADEAAAPEASSAESGAVGVIPAPILDEEGLKAALGISGDRAARLLEALAVVGSRAAQGLKVRVLSGDGTPPPGAKKQGDFYYVVDVPGRVDQDQRHGGRGRGGHDERRGGGGGHGGRGSRPGGAGRGHSGLEREPPRTEVPATGAGWVLQRAPSDPNDKHGGARRGPRGRRPDGSDHPGGGRGRPGGGPGRGGPGGGPGRGGPGGGPGRGGPGGGPGRGGPGGGPGRGGPGGGPGRGGPGGGGAVPPRGPS